MGIYGDASLSCLGQRCVVLKTISPNFNFNPFFTITLFVSPILINSFFYHSQTQSHNNSSFHNSPNSVNANELCCMVVVVGFFFFFLIQIKFFEFFAC